MHLIEQARAALRAAGGDPLYARVDGILRGELLLLMELELIEPALFLASAPGAVRVLAEAISRRLGAERIGIGRANQLL